MSKQTFHLFLEHKYARILNQVQEPRLQLISIGALLCRAPDVSQVCTVCGDKDFAPSVKPKSAPLSKDLRLLTAVRCTQCVD